MSDELVVVKTFGYVWEAHFAQAALEAVGIESSLAGEQVYMTAPFAANPVGIQLEVRREDADQAVEVLDNLRPSTNDANNADVTRAEKEH